MSVRSASDRLGAQRTRTSETGGGARRALRSLALLALVGAGVVLPPAPVAAQCAMCQTALTASQEGRNIAQQFNRAILLMLVAPYLVFGSLATVAFRRPIRARLARMLPWLKPVLGEAAPPRPPSPPEM